VLLHVVDLLPCLCWVHAQMWLLNTVVLQPAFLLCSCEALWD
jgi:hypothetical protein